MAEGTVLSTAEGRARMEGMKSTLQGALLESINKFIVDADEIYNNPGLWDGKYASDFRAEWPTVKSTLQLAHSQLTELNDSCINVDTNIQTAGGNA